MFHHRLLPILLLPVLAALPLAAQQDDKTECRIIYVPTEEAVVEKMLDMAGVNKEVMAVVRSVNRIIDVANAEQEHKRLPLLSLDELFSGRVDLASVKARKEMGEALKKVNDVIERVNAENVKRVPNVTLSDLLDGKSDYATPAIARLLKELQKKSDVVYDLGCGDGRIVCLAARNYGAKGVGVDIDPARIKDSLETMKKYQVTKEQVDIRQGDALKVKDLDKATVITFYMLPEFMEKLEPQIKKLRPGTRLVAHDYPFPNLKPDQKIDYRGPNRDHTLYLWVLKENQ